MSEAMLTSHQDPQNDELNFTAFTDLCRLCSLKIGHKLQLFDKDAEQRQILFKVRSILPTVVSRYFPPIFFLFKMQFFLKDFQNLI